MVKEKSNKCKEREVILEQRASGCNPCYLLWQGTFMHAYDGAACAIARVIKCKVRLRSRKNGLAFLAAGFTVNHLPNVLDAIKAHGGEILSKTDKMVTFTGLDTSTEGIDIVEPRKILAYETGLQNAELIELIGNFDLEHAAPADAMALIAKVQESIRK